MLDRKRKHFGSAVAKAVVKVGKGRGFVIQFRWELPPFQGKRSFVRQRIVITAAHCLPFLPPCIGKGYLEERTCESLLGPLDAQKSEVWADCLLADPIGDIAVLCSPDVQELGEQAEAYEALTMEVPALRVAKAPQSGDLGVVAFAVFGGTGQQQNTHNQRQGLDGAVALFFGYKVPGAKCIHLRN